MLAASVYIIVCTARNRLRQRLRRLREPRYLIGAVVGAAYLYFTFFARVRMARSGADRRRSARITRPPLLVLSAIRGAMPGVIGLALLAITAVAWILPFDSGLLDFSESEIQFLFPAPVSRRGLLIHRLLRSQLGLLFSSLVAAVLLPSMSGYSRLQVAAAMWVLLTTGKVYFTGISLARSRLASSDARARRVAWLPVVVLTAALLVVGRAAALAFAVPPASVQDLLIRIGGVTTTGPSAIVLWPFIALARPVFAEWPWPYLRALALAAAVLLACVAWVLQIDAAFEDAAATFSQRRAQEPRRGRTVYRARTGAPPLSERGRPELAFAWKAATQTFRLIGGVALVRTVALGFAVAVMAASLMRASGAAALLGSFAVGASLFAVVLGPQVLRLDMRDDLQHLEALKTWPVRSAAVVRGELLWPGALLTVIAWTMVLVAEVLAVGTVLGGLNAAMRLSIGAAFAIIAPALVFAQLTIHNAAALIFPAWVPLGNQRARGLDALGQRLIMFFGTWVVLAIGTLPGAIAGAIVWLALSRALGPASMIAAALVCGATLAIEVLLVTEALGPAYESLDLTAVERSE
jgi:putative ABC exporter